ncbi:METL4 protein, partial [Nothocercus nigrocapillus]|nr:METL4 protein [Nothocercus nigrocapillus]
MSVVQRLGAGWLLDHLSFINQCGYETHGSLAHPPRGALDTCAPSVGHCCAASACATTCALRDDPAPGDTVELEGKRGKIRYVFREEFFDVLKPRIVAAAPERLCQGGSKGSPTDTISWFIYFHCLLTLQKRKRKCVFNQGELDALEYHTKIRDLILEGTSHLVQEGFKSGFLHCTTTKLNCSKNVVPGHVGCGLAELCEMAKQFPAINDCDHEAVRAIDDETFLLEQDLHSCVVENNSSCAKMIVLMGQKYLVPPKSNFLLSDISCLQPLLNCKKKYDVIVMDPPWENKSVKRSNRYGYLSSWQIKQIPVSALAAPNCLVVTWVTNRQKHLRFVKEELYPHWSVKTLAEWHWVKITRSGEFVFPLDSSHKKPYEVLVLGRVQDSIEEALRKSEEVLPIPDHKLIVSIPCSLHSHKPPLAEVLAEFVKPDAEYLELFARNLQPGWTSWGNEVLKFQHIDYFTVLQDE